MNDERTFLSAISTNPTDWTTRLVYADWLEERGDVRSEFVRLQVRLVDLSPGDPEYPSLKTREQELRPRCSAYWLAILDPAVLAILDPAVWCLVGNIVGEHLSGSGGEET